MCPNQPHDLGILTLYHQLAISSLSGSGKGKENFIALIGQEMLDLDLRLMEVKVFIL